LPWRTPSQRHKGFRGVRDTPLESLVVRGTIQVAEEAKVTIQAMKVGRGTIQVEMVDKGIIQAANHTSP
jgi:hypothetical protein